jgi:putative PIN family toxin of toxin-antitoxin system
MKVVFDTNVYVSAFLVPGSHGEEAFLLAHRRHLKLYTSVAILTETAGVLRIKFGQEDEDIKAALKLIARAAKVLRPSARVNILRDLPDNRILECAKEAEADVIVTGDRDILKLGRFEGISIIRLVDLLRMFPEKN